MRPQKLAVNGERQKKPPSNIFCKLFSSKFQPNTKREKFDAANLFYLKSQRFRKFIHKFGFHDAKSQPLIIHSKFENNILLCCAVYQISSSRHSQDKIFSSFLIVSLHVFLFASLHLHKLMNFSRCVDTNVCER